MDRTTPIESLVQETQTWVEQYQARRRADLHRLNSELAGLEARRTELTERVSQDNADRSAQIDLNRVDQGIEDVKDRIGALRDEVRSTVIAKRRELSEILNSRIAELQEEASRKRHEKERIRTEALPSLELQREKLMEHSRELESDILHLTERISGLNRIQIESEDLEFD